MGPVLVVGSCTKDCNEVRGTTQVKMGGVVTYAGLTYRKHGLPVTVVTNIAVQDEELVGKLAQRGVHLCRGTSKTTTVFVNRVSGNDRRQEVPCRADPIPAERILSLVDSSYHVHLGPLHPDDIEPRFFALAKTQRPVALDVQGYVRQIVAGKVRRRVASVLPEVLRASDIVKGDGVEIRTILDRYRMNVWDLTRTYDVREVVITEGRKGGCVISKAGERVPYEAKPVDRVADPTGAGDVFFGSYLVARLHWKRGIGESCEHASRAAARQVEGRWISEKILRLSETGHAPQAES